MRIHVADRNTKYQRAQTTFTMSRLMLKDKVKVRLSQKKSSKSFPRAMPSPILNFKWITSKWHQITK